MTKPYNYDQTVIDNFFNITVRPPDKSAYQKIILLFLNQTFVVGTQKNRLDETALLSTPKHNMF